MRTVTGRISNRMPPGATGVARGASVAGSIRKHERKLRKALRNGKTLDALTAAAKIHAAAVEPNMGDGRWPDAQAYCERMLSHIPARESPGYEPRLRGVLECLHGDAARAARASGDLHGAKSHLTALIGYLDERGAPAAQQVEALIDLAYLHINSDDPRAGGRVLARIGPLLESATSGTCCGFAALPDLWHPPPRLLVPAQRQPAD
jgi:hypothetical protein